MTMVAMAAMLVTIAAVSFVFAGYFFFGSDRIANKNVLDRRIKVLSARHQRKFRKLDALEALLNHVFVIDERLVRMKAAMATILVLAGGFLLLVSYMLLAR